MDEDLIRKIIKYVEETEVTIDGEWGYGRTLEEIISESEITKKDGGNDAYMPDFYFKLKEMISES